ncbi:nuclear transport factor 2 family protein [Gordonia sp. NPDC003376]
MAGTVSASDPEPRLRRLEAAEEIRCAITRYTQLMDAGLIDDLMELFMDDARFLSTNEPPGTGGSKSLQGRDEIETHYRGLPFGWFRHHIANTAVDVSPSADHAELSSYFITAFPGGVQGGLYEVGFRLDTAYTWRIQRLQITSSWGWGTKETGFHYFEQLGDRTFRGGHPVVWNETVHDPRDGHRV